MKRPESLFEKIFQETSLKTAKQTSLWTTFLDVLEAFDETEKAALKAFFYDVRQRRALAKRSSVKKINDVKNLTLRDLKIRQRSILHLNVRLAEIRTDLKLHTLNLDTSANRKIKENLVSEFSEIEDLLLSIHEKIGSLERVRGRPSAKTHKFFILEFLAEQWQSFLQNAGSKIKSATDGLVKEIGAQEYNRTSKEKQRVCAMVHATAQLFLSESIAEPHSILKAVLSSVET